MKNDEQNKHTESRLPVELPIIYSYTRAQALEDGALVDISRLAEEVGFKCPVAVTSAVDVLLNDYRHDGQDFQGRAWDLLMVLRFEIMRSKNTDILYFAPYFNSWNHEEPKPYKLWAKCGPGDSSEPVITVMFVGED